MLCYVILYRYILIIILLLIFIKYQYFSNISNDNERNYYYKINNYIIKHDIVIVNVVFLGSKQTFTK